MAEPARCQTTLLGGKVTVKVIDISLPCCELDKLDEYNLTWPCGSLLVVNGTGNTLTVRVAKINKNDPARQVIPGTERTVQISPKGSAEIAWYRDKLADQEYILSVVQVSTESKEYTLLWTLLTAALTGIVVSVAMNIYEKSKEKGKSLTVTQITKGGAGS